MNPQTEKAVTIVDDGLRALSAEMRSQRALALEKPRSEKKVIEAALEELRAFPEFAKAAYYSIPYKDPETGEKKPVEGPSVKASRAMMRRWGNCATASRIMDETDDRYQVEGLFVDFETNTIFRRTVSVSKSYIPKSTRTKTPLRDDRLTMALQSGMSKGERNATLAGLPVAFVETYVAEAKRIAASGKVAGSKKVQTVAERYTWLRESFLKYGVKAETLMEHVDEHVGDNASDEQRIAYMIGLYNSVRDGQVKLDEVFSKQPDAGAKKDGQTTLDGALKGKGAKAA